MREEKKKEKKIVVLDAGINTEDMVEPASLCCRGPFFPYR